MAPKERPRALRSATKPSPRASRNAKPATSYREPSTDIEDSPEEVSEESDNSDASENLPLAVRRSKRKIPSAKSSPSKRPRNIPSRPTRLPPTRHQRHAGPSEPSRIPFEPTVRQRQRVKHRQIGHPLKHNTKPLPAIVDRDPYSSGITPNWLALPYHILVQVFHYASLPLYDDRTFQPTSSVQWLLNTSRVCHAFTEAALTPLYSGPPLVPMERAHKLCQLLAADSTLFTYNYRAKVERLQMEVSQTAAYTLPGFGLLDLAALVYDTPRLLDLELYHQRDMSPYRSLESAIRWTYPEGMFMALNQNVEGVPTKLRSWRWSSRMAGKRWPIEKLREIHQTPSFIGLRKLAFINYQVVQSKKTQTDPEHEKVLADSLSILPHLEHLTFESSTLLNELLFPLLPRNLRHLELINCWEVTSDMMSVFLATHGSQLRSLTLNHNHSLNLSFLPVLKDSCPHLTTFRMNLTYFNIHATYRDSEPLYTALLHDGEIPTWPATLQTIELTQLRKWETGTAETFFQSLLDSSDSLPDLRRLVIKAILDSISWRDRGAFRDKWVGSFERVFKKKFVPPNPHLRSIGAYNAYQKSLMMKDQQHEDISKEGYNPRAQKVLNGINTGMQPETTDTELRSKAGASRSEDGHVTRPRRVQLSYAEDSDEEEEEEAEEDGYDDKEEDHSAHKDFADDMTTTTARRLPREVEILKQTAGKNRFMEEIPSEISHRSPRNETDGDSEDEPLASRSNAGQQKHAEFIQGKCEVVDIRIDNLRPTETQFEEADFLDSEPEGDEDWDGGEDAPGGGEYAW